MKIGGGHKFQCKQIEGGGKISVQAFRGGGDFSAQLFEGQPEATKIYPKIFRRRWCVVIYFNTLP